MVDAIVLAPCKEIIGRAQFLISAENDASLRINKQQCELLVKRLSETQSKLDKFHDALHEEAIRERISSFPDLGPAIEEIHRVLEGSETLIKNCCCNDQWLMAAIRQGDKKETFAKFLYDLQWCTSVLNSILLTLMTDDNSVNIVGPAECNGNLGAFDYFDLSTAAKQDREDLKASLSDWKADHVCGAESCDQHLTEQCLAAKLVAKLDAEALQDDDSSDLSTSPLFLWVNEQHPPDDKLIGGGGFGEVWETRWRGETYAKKTCRAIFKTFFYQELGALAKLHHPHIVNLVCCCRDKSTFSLIMELMDKSLSQHLEEHREENVTGAVPFSHLQAVNLMLEVAEGMKYIHSRKLVHRDLKSPNILINFSRDSCIAKVADFGLTKIKNASTAHQTPNLGTTKWMAPEVFNLAEDEVRPSRFHPMKMDVYSFAIVCWEVLTGEVPFEDEQNRSQMKRNVKMGMRPKLPPDCPRSLADLIQRCWDGNPRLRPDFPEICTRLRYIKGRLLQGESKNHLVSDDKWMIVPLQGKYNWAHSWMLPKAGRGIISFTSEGNYDVHIAISPCPETMDPMYEIVIRGWNKTACVIRRKSQGLPLCATQCNMLHSGTQFWVSIDDQTRIIQVGEGVPCHNVFCIYEDVDFISEAQHVSFTTWDICKDEADVWFIGLKASVASTQLRKSTFASKHAEASMLPTRKSSHLT